MKAHESAIQNDDFRTELNALIQLGTVPHVAPLLAIVVEKSKMDNTFYVCGILLKYYIKGDLKTLLQSEPPVEMKRKWKWAAQIAHGLMGIHDAGILHGDLRCDNVVVDESDDAHVIDIINGHGYTEGSGCAANLQSFRGKNEVCPKIN